MPIAAAILVTGKGDIGAGREVNRSPAQRR
jgi:hypothetical protein